MLKPTHTDEFMVMQTDGMRCPTLRTIACRVKCKFTHSTGRCSRNVCRCFPKRLSPHRPRDEDYGGAGNYQPRMDRPPYRDDDDRDYGGEGNHRSRQDRPRYGDDGRDYGGEGYGEGGEA